MTIKGTTSSGLEFEIDKAVLSDVRFIRAARKMIGKDEAEQVEGADALLLMLFPEGSEAEEALFSHCADEYGHVPLEQVYKEVGEMLAIAKEKDSDAKK